MTAVCIILGVILLIVGILSIPVNAVAVYDSEFSLYIKYLFLRFRVFPEKENKKKKNKPKKAKEKSNDAPKKNKKKKDNIFLKFYHNQGFSGTLDLIKDTAGVLNDYVKSIFLKHLVINNAVINMKVVGSDSADTALKYGKISAAVYPSVTLIKSKMKVRKCRINITPDFIGEESTSSFLLDMKVRPIGLLNATLYFAFRILKRFIKVASVNNSADKEKQKTVNKYLNKAKENA